MPKKKAVAKKSSKKKAIPAKVAARPKGATSKSPKAVAKQQKAARPQAKRKARVPIRGTAGPAGPVALSGRGLGSDAAGQSGDTEGLSKAAIADSESVEELAEEGQAFEAEAISGVEGARDADEGEVTTREVPEDDVPEEYLDDQD